MQLVPLPAFVAMQQALKQQQQQQQQQTEQDQSGKDLDQTDSLPLLSSAEVNGHRGCDSCGISVGYRMAEVLESKGKHEERTEKVI